MDKSPIRVFLLDDHEVVRRGLHDLLESEGDIEIVGESGSVREAIARIPALRPDVAVLDGGCLTAAASTCAARSGRSTETSRL
jgi:two-component system response regulator DevR